MAALDVQAMIQQGIRESRPLAAINGGFWRANIKSAIYLLISLCLFVDSLNGVLIREYSISISPLYKGAIMAALLIRGKRKVTLVTIAAMIASLCCLLFYADGDIGLRIDWVFKFLFMLLLCDFFASDVARGELRGIFAVCAASFAIIFVNLLLGYFGYGYSQYTGGAQEIGTRGFFYAGNELSVAIICSSGVLLARLTAMRRTVAFFGFAAVALIACGMSTMKASALSVMLLIVLMPISQTRFVARELRIRRTLVVALLAMPLLVSGLVFYIINYTDLLGRMSYFYDLNGPLTLIFSQRDRWAIEAFEIFRNYSFVEVLFGGSEWTGSMSNLGIVEIDPVDIVMSFGLVGLAIISSPFYRALASQRKSVYSSQIRMVLVLLIAVSCTAGHVTFSGLAAPVVACLLALAGYQEQRGAGDAGARDRQLPV